MSTTWERYAGREDRFAIRLSLRPDPDDGAAWGDMGLSWGSFQIWVEGKNLCAHADQGETLDHVHWYLLPLVEWLVENWDPAFHEERLPVKVRGTTASESLQQTLVPSAAASSADTAAWEDDWFGWWQRHSLRAARAGGPFPALTLRRWRDLVELSWDDNPLAGDVGLSFLASGGMARLAPVDVAAPLLEVVTAAAQEFARCQSSERLLALVSRVQEIELPERQDTRVAWMAGLRSGTDSVRESWRRVERAFDDAPKPAREAALGVTMRSGVVVGSCQAALLFGAVAPDVSAADVQRLAHLVIEQYAPGSETDELARLVKPVPVSPDSPAWQDGYERAEETREALDLARNQPVDIRALLEQLGIEQRHEALEDATIRGVALASPEHRPTIVTNDRSVFASPTAQRFTLAHEFCHLLFDRAQGQRLAVASGPWAPLEVEQRANAFAAYLLMPPDGIRTAIARLTGPLGSREEVEEVARHFGVGWLATVEHLHNVGLLDDATRAHLRGWTVQDG